MTALPSPDPGARYAENRRKSRAKRAAEAAEPRPLDITPRPRTVPVRREPRPDFPHLARHAYGPPSRRLAAPLADVTVLDDYRPTDVDPQQLYDAG